MAVSPSQDAAVVTNSQSRELHVVSLRSGRLLRRISGYATPRNLLFAPSGDRILLTDSTLGVLDILDPLSGCLLDRFPMGPGVFGTALSKDGRMLYANNASAGTVTVVDLGQRIPVTVIQGFAQPRQGVKLTADDKLLYVTNFKADRISTVDTATNTIVGQIEGFKDVRGLSITRDGGTLFAANSGDNTISVVDTRSGSTIRRVPVGTKPYGAALAPNEGFVVSGDMGSNTLTIFDARTGTVQGSVSGLKAPRQAISFRRDSAVAWVLNSDLTIAEVDLVGRRILRTLG